MFILKPDALLCESSVYTNVMRSTVSVGFSHVTSEDLKMAGTEAPECALQVIHCKKINF